MRHVRSVGIRVMIGLFILGITWICIGGLAELINAKDHGIPVLQSFDTGIIEDVSNRPYTSAE